MAKSIWDGLRKRPLPWLVGGILVGLVAIATLLPLALISRRADYDLDDYTTVVETDALAVRVTASGNVQPVQTVNVSPKTGGIVAELRVEQGDSVTQGQVLARMENNDLQAELQQRRASLAEANAQLADVRDGNRPGEIAQASAAAETARAQLQDAEARLTLARQRLERNQALVDRGAIAQNEMDGVVNEFRTAQAGVNQAEARLAEAQARLTDVETQPELTAIAAAEARVAQAQAQLAATQVRLEDTLIRAPFSGIITQKFATVGAFVTPTTSASEVNSATSTAIIAIASGLEILAEVPEADINQIYPGQQVEIQADAFPDDLYRGEVRLIAPEAIERQNVTLFQVRIDLVGDLIGDRDNLRSNMNVDVAFIGDAVENALVVPTVAIITQGGEPGVLVPGQGDRPQFRPVVLGPQAGNQIQIIEGLEAGERVFTDLPPGQRLENLTFGGSDSPAEAE
ncbi:MAG: efflux RND transporter periplasmic adaptor subunit [Cyanobacteria bacterium P01_C01_bin.73]